MTTPTKAEISQIAKDAARKLYSEWDEGIFLPDKGAQIIQSAITASLPDPNKLLHAVVNPTDMVARCGFKFKLDKPASLLNAEPKEVCHECAVMAYAAAENKASDLAEQLAGLPQWIPVGESPKANGRYETASFIKNRWIIDISEWDGGNFRGEDEFYEILTVHYYKELPLPPQPEDGK